MTDNKTNLRRQTDLSGIWQLGCFDGQRGDSLERMLAVPGRTWDAEVPGDVHEALLKHGLIAEPTLGLNSLHCQWVSQRLWFYKRSFASPAREPGERVWITFESLDLGAAIYINGKEIGRHANRFYPFRADVTDALADGENILVVEIESGLIHAANRSASGMGIAFDGEMAKRPWLRKPQSSFGWDWSPRLLPVGILGPVYIEVARTARIDQISVFTEVTNDLKQGKLTVRLVGAPVGSEAVVVRISVAIEELQLHMEQEVSLAHGAPPVAVTLEVSGPELWWPVGHGAARLYEAAVTVSDARGVLGGTRRRVGFRHLRINQEPHPVRGNYFLLEINRRPVFVKGANFVPEDIIDRRIPRETVETLVDRALEANFNCLRVWGGGVYESDTFYELCDERGVLVWQEFIFACSKYPATDEGFLKDVVREAAYQVRRLAHHASLFLWCGNNEIESAHYSWGGFQKGVMNPDHGLFHMVLPRLVKQEDPSRHYHPSSPYSGEGLHPDDPDSGDQHAWSVGFHETDFRLYRKMTCRFPDEAGFLGSPSLPTVKACLTPEHPGIGSFAWEHHDNSVSYWGKTSAPDATLDQWFGIPIGEMSLEDYVFHAGLVQGEALGEFIRNFRRRKFDSAAAVFWMFNDVWPTVRSWVIVDYYLRRTPAFHPVRRAFAPLTVVVTQEENRVRIYGVNEGPMWQGRLRFGIFALAGGYPLSRQIDVSIAPNASTCLAEFDHAEWEKLGIETHAAFALLSQNGEVAAQDRLILPFFKAMRWAEPEIRVERVGERVRFSCDQFAWNVCLDLDGEKALPDNFFDLLPGVPREFSWPASLGEPKILRTGNGIAGFKHKGTKSTEKHKVLK